MALRYIDNVTILTDVGEDVSLPMILIARLDDGNLTPVNVSWTPSTVDVSTEGEFIFIGRVSGYVHDVLCSVQVGKMEHNPASIFPEEIDRFGLPKQEIQTADIPDIDDYQYFKAKMPRTTVEEYQLKQLRELLVDKIILARDINHMRNAIIAIEENALDMQEQIDKLKERLDDLEERVDKIEEIMVTDGKNVGRGEEVFKQKRSKKLEFRTLVGKGQADVFEDGDEIVIDVDAPVGCGHDVYGDMFKTCGTGELMPVSIHDGIVSFANYFNFQMVKIKDGDGGSPKGYNMSLMGVFGVGDSEERQNNAGRFLKGTDKFIFEFKVKENKYVGFEFGKNGFITYDDDTSSRVDAEMYEGEAYSSFVSTREKLKRNEKTA